MGKYEKADALGYNILRSLDPQSVLELYEEAYKIKQEVEGGKDITAIDFDHNAMLSLLIYLRRNIKDIDEDLFKFLCKLLGISFEKEKEKAEEEEQEREEELSEEQRMHLYRLFCYEMHKILNPRQLAGETPLENFINNVVTRGVKVAIQEAPQYIIEAFDKESLDALESLKPSFVDAISKGGGKGFGRGL